MISVSHINKSYSKTAQKAVDDVSFEVQKGEIFGLIGPDGAGKSTLFRIIATLILADSGTVTIEGLDVVKDYKKIRTITGYMPGKFSLYQDLTVRENLEFFAKVFGTSISENYDLIRDIYVQLEPFNDRRAGKLSGGMKQKLALCCAMIHQPKILLLDEPTTGVDPVSRKEFWAMLKHYQQMGITIIVATPYMDEAAMCGRIALIKNGMILKINTPTEIIDTYPFQIVAVKATVTYDLIEALKKYTKLVNYYAFGEYVHVVLPADSASGEKELNNWLLQNNIGGIEMHRINPNIEDSFIDILQ